MFSNRPIHDQHNVCSHIFWNHLIFISKKIVKKCKIEYMQIMVWDFTHQSTWAFMERTHTDIKKERSERAMFWRAQRGVRCNGRFYKVNSNTSIHNKMERSNVSSNMRFNLPHSNFSDHITWIFYTKILNYTWTRQLIIQIFPLVK